MLNEHVVESFNSGRGRAVFQYLIVHRDRPVPREVLMERFWPEAAPEAARNSLNVAVHHARQAFRALTEAPIILYKDGAYSLNPDLRLWVDFVSFERHVQHARKLEAEGLSGEACAAYRRVDGADTRAPADYVPGRCGSPEPALYEPGTLRAGGKPLPAYPRPG